MRIVFAGTPHFADTILNALLNADCSLNYEVVAVFTQPDRPSGRGMKQTPSPVKQTALKHGIPIFQPHSLKLDGQYSEEANAACLALTELQPDVMVVAAYGLILPQWTLNLPAAGCINVHASLLPRWRGAAPIQRAIQSGDTTTGVGLMHMELGLDTGGVYAEQTLEITPSITGGQLHDQLATMGADLLCQQLGAIVSGKLHPVAQALDGITYAHKLTRENGNLNWHMPAQLLVNQIRAFDPTPGCSFKQVDAHGNTQIYKVWAAQLVNNTVPNDYQIGDIVSLSDAGLDIACAAESNHTELTILRITEIQKPGGKRLPVSVCWQHLGLLKPFGC